MGALFHPASNRPLQGVLEWRADSLTVPASLPLFIAEHLPIGLSKGATLPSETRAVELEPIVATPLEIGHGAIHLNHLKRRSSQSGLDWTLDWITEFLGGINGQSNRRPTMEGVTYQASSAEMTKRLTEGLAIKRLGDEGFACFGTTSRFIQDKGLTHAKFKAADYLAYAGPGRTSVLAIHSFHDSRMRQINASLRDLADAMQSCAHMPGKLKEPVAGYIAYSGRAAASPDLRLAFAYASPPESPHSSDALDLHTAREHYLGWLEAMGLASESTSQRQPEEFTFDIYQIGDQQIAVPQHPPMLPLLHNIVVPVVCGMEVNTLKAAAQCLRQGWSRDSLSELPRTPSARGSSECPVNVRPDGTAFGLFSKLSSLGSESILL